ncbi:hypothetical protein GCM10007063_27780 [Lentibacillus kapialis]|uniref:DUF3231 family protein n=1 Tax=Lentibacillus kapialis TaxID=340214 RepID=A0A917Q086_9BACI|nr:DUF3231 family protein [Lentibacillus kapialis]GGK03882.1 hypothetical protein GCM10007063_27780 [Lentibacillus kapialis]
MFGGDNIENPKHKLTSVEIGSLWSAYISASLSQRVLQYFIAKMTDEEMKQVVEHSLSLSEHYLQSIEEIFTSEGYPVPEGFTENDVNTDAPRLFSDTFCLIYVKHMANYGLRNYGTYYAYSSDQRTLTFFEDALARTITLQDQATTLMLDKGVYSHAPYLSYPDHSQFIQDEKHYLNTGLFTDDRPLNAIEIRHLYASAITNTLAGYLLLGFSQVADSQEVRNHMLKGKSITDSHRESLNQKIRHENLDPPSFPMFEVADSTISPFSDKLMMGHVAFLSGIGIADYGTSMGQSQRSDLTVLYGKLMTRALRYAKNSAELAIQNKWLEQPPQFKRADYP